MVKKIISEKDLSIKEFLSEGFAGTAISSTLSVFTVENLLQRVNNVVYF